MSTELVEYKIDEREVNIFKKNFAPKASAVEWELFLYTCEAYGLSPLKKQIYLVSRWDTESHKNKATPQISIDGLRLLAQRTGEYQGQVGPFWCGEDGIWTDVWLNRNEQPYAAKVGVWRKGFREPLFKVVYFDAVAAKKRDGELTAFWKKMGPHMIAKCSEAASIRAAFPETDGLYIHEEMNQADMEASFIKITPEVENDPEAPAVLGEVVQHDPDSVSVLRARVNEINPTSRKGEVMTFEYFYQVVTKNQYTSDDAISPEESDKLNRQLDAIVQARANKKAS